MGFTAPKGIDNAAFMRHKYLNKSNNNFHLKEINRGMKEQIMKNNLVFFIIIIIHFLYFIIILKPRF